MKISISLLSSLLTVQAFAADLEVIRGGTSSLPADTDKAQAFRLRDGRVIVGNGGTSYWSSDGGRTWVAGPKGPGTSDIKTAIDFGNGEILGLKVNTSESGEGDYKGQLVRSTDGWKTRSEIDIRIATPESVPYSSDSGELIAKSGMRFFHGLVQLQNGDLMATMYGTYASDREFVQGGDSKCRDAFQKSNFRKFRSIVVFSSDRGLTWGRPVTVGSYQMIRPSSQVTEGFNEADVVVAQNGDLVMAMRTGGVNNDCGGYKGSPIYISRSSDSGQTWTLPSPITETVAGSNPTLVVLPSGIIAMSYGRPGSYLMFSTDNGVTWQQRTVLSTENEYNDVVQIASDKILAFYFKDKRVVSTVYTVRLAAPSISISAQPTTTQRGDSARLIYSSKSVTGCTLSGGKFGSGQSVRVSDPSRTTGPLTADTTFTLRCTGTDGSNLSKSVTIKVK